MQFSVTRTRSMSELTSVSKAPQKIDESKSKAPIQRRQSMVSVSTKSVLSLDLGSQIDSQIDKVPSLDVESNHSLVPKPPVRDRMLGLSLKQNKFVRAMKIGSESFQEAFLRLEKKHGTIPESAGITGGDLKPQFLQGLTDTQRKLFDQLKHDGELDQAAAKRLKRKEGPSMAFLESKLGDLDPKQLKMLKAMRRPDESLVETRKRLFKSDVGVISPDGIDDIRGIKALAMRREALTNPDIQITDREAPTTVLKPDRKASLIEHVGSMIKEDKAEVEKLTKKRSTLRALVQSDDDVLKRNTKLKDELLEEISSPEFKHLSPHVQQEKRYRLDRIMKQLADTAVELKTNELKLKAVIKSISFYEQRIVDCKSDLKGLKAGTHGARLPQLLHNERHVFRKMIEEVRAEHPRDDEHSIWEKVKAKFLESEDSSPFLMFALTDFRKQFVNGLVEEVRKDLGVPTDLLKTAAFGSTNLTSDYDMRLEVDEDHVGLDTRMMKEFNTRFSKEWGVESGSLFDTNLYTKGTVPDFIEEHSTGRLTFTDPAIRKRHNMHQDTMALVKQRRFMTQSEWDTFTTLMIEDLPHDKKQDAREVYDEANRLHLQYESRLKERVDAKKEALGTEIRKLKSQVKTLSSRKTPLSAKEQALLKELKGKLERAEELFNNKEALELVASNRLYERELKQADATMKQALKAKALGQTAKYERLMEKALFQHGKALFYASEPYFSQGTLRDVVLNQQAIPGYNRTHPGRLYESIAINPSDALQSMNENYGDALKDFKHYGDHGGETAYHGCKYMQRVCKGMDQALEALDLTTVTLTPRQSTQLQRATAIRDAILNVVDDLKEIRSGDWSPDIDGTGMDKEAYAQAVQDAKNQRALEILHREPLLQGITSTDDLQDLLSEMVCNINVVLRSHMDLSEI